MTWLNPPKLNPSKNKSKANLIRPEDLAASGSEDGNQAALFCWAALNTEQYPQLKNLFAIPNGGNRHIVEAIKFVGTGTRAGVPDVMLAYAALTAHDMNWRYHGLFIEMKKEIYRNRKNGGRSDEQIAWGDRLVSAGYCVKTCYNWEEARDTILKYLEGEL